MSTLYTSFPAVLVCAVLAMSPMGTAPAAVTQSAAAAPGATLAGTWRVSVHDTDGVELDFRMTFAVRGRDQPLRWEAYSRQGAVREIVGARTAVLGGLLGRTPAKGALVYIGDGVAEQDGGTLRLTGALESPLLGRRAVRGSMAEGRMQAELTRIPSGARAGTLEAVPDSSAEPLRDYRALAADLERAIRSTLFDPALLPPREFQEFFGGLAARFARARDDLDAVAAFQALKPSLGISHFELIRNPRLAARSLDDVLAGDPNVNPDSLVQLAFPAPLVAVLRVSKWDRVGTAVDRAFGRIALKVGRRAMLIGERTAGRMLTALPQPLRDGWVTTIPEADFIAADFTRLEGHGVEPHVRTNPNDAYFAVADRIANEMPYSAAVLRGNYYEAQNRPQDAEPAYRSALRLVDRQRPEPSLASRVRVHKRLAVILARRGDKQGALREYARVLTLAPDDAEALAAVKGRI